MIHGLRFDNRKGGLIVSSHTGRYQSPVNNFYLLHLRLHHMKRLAAGGVHSRGINSMMYISGVQVKIGSTKNLVYYYIIVIVLDQHWDQIYWEFIPNLASPWFSKWL